MEYNSQLKVNDEIFDKIKIIDVQNHLVLKPIFAGALDEEAQDNEILLYSAICNSPEIKRFLPTVFADNKIAAKKILFDFVAKMLLKQCLFYVFRFKENSLPIGYINLNTPISNTGLNDWSLDFWIASFMSGKGLMAASLQALLIHLQTNLVPIVYAQVDMQNVRSIKTLESVGFGKLNESLKDKIRWYGVRLNY